MLSPLFNQVHCVFMYFIEGMEHQQPVLNYPLRYKNTIVHQFPHWMVSHYYKNSYFRFHQPGDKESKTIMLGDIEQAARIKTGCNWVVNGAKRSDSLNRNLMLGALKFNCINEKSQRIYPLSEWKKAEVIAYIKQKRLIKPTEYTTAKSNGIDLNLETLLFLRSNFPGDYAKMIKHFPFAEKIIFEYEYKQQHSHSSKI